VALGSLPGVDGGFGDGGFACGTIIACPHFGDWDFHRGSQPPGLHRR